MVAASSNDPTKDVVRITTSITKAEKLKLEEIALERSEAGKTVARSNVVREAIRDYITKYENNPEACKPGDRGTVRANEA